jgi:hypothetical protein
MAGTIIVVQKPYSSVIYYSNYPNMATTKERSARLVKVTYGSRKARGNALGKKLFGYKSWSVKAGKREYSHKPIVGSLEGLPVKRVGRSKFVVPEEKLRDIEGSIKTNGGVIRRVEPVAMDEKEVEKNARRVYRGFIDPLIEKMKYASDTQDKELYIESLESGIRLVTYFEKFLNELDDYGTRFVQEEGRRESEFIKRMKALESIANEDFEAAKIQTEFFASGLEDLRDQILK